MKMKKRTHIKNLQVIILEKANIKKYQLKMASKQPFKLINITQKLTTWSIRINKFLKHRLLSKRKNVLLIGEDDVIDLKSLQSLYTVDRTKNDLKVIQISGTSKANESNMNFEQALLNNLYKTWEITQIKSINDQSIEQLQSVKPASQQKSSTPVKGQPLPQEEPSTIVLSNFKDKQAIQLLQKKFTQKKKYFDSIIVMPEKQSQLERFPQITDQAFATSYIKTLEEKMMKNIVAYRLAHKFLNTSGTFIQSTSEYDFLKKTQEELKKQSDEKKDEPNTSIQYYSTERPPAAKQIIDHSVNYLGVVVGDRDYTDLNSWTLVSLSQEASWKNPTYVAKMYYDWADGQHLPMPGSFTLFKRKIFTNDNNRELNFVQYL